MTPLEKIQRDMKVVELVKGAKKPLQTTFRKSHSFSMGIELCELFSRLRTEYNVNVSAEAEPVLKKLAIKLARRLTQKPPKHEQNAWTSTPAQSPSSK